MDLDNSGESSEGFRDTNPEHWQSLALGDVISQAIVPLIQHALDIAAETPEVEAIGLYDRFLREMRNVFMTHTLLDLPDIQLIEEEVVLWVIRVLAKSTQPRLRKDRAYRMSLHAETFVRDIRARIVPEEEGWSTEKYFRDGLQKAWATWATGAGLSITGTRDTSRASPLLYLASCWTASSSSVHYPAPELEGVSIQESAMLKNAQCGCRCSMITVSRLA
jgi:hypothetical protein